MTNSTPTQSSSSSSSIGVDSHQTTSCEPLLTTVKFGCLMYLWYDVLSNSFVLRPCVLCLDIERRFLLIFDTEKQLMQYYSNTCNLRLTRLDGGSSCFKTYWSTKGDRTFGLDVKCVNLQEMRSISSMSCSTLLCQTNNDEYRWLYDEVSCNAGGGVVDVDDGRWHNHHQQQQQQNSSSSNRHKYECDVVGQAVNGKADNDDVENGRCTLQKPPQSSASNGFMNGIKLAANLFSRNRSVLTVDEHQTNCERSKSKKSKTAKQQKTTRTCINQRPILVTRPIDSNNDDVGGGYVPQSPTPAATTANQPNNHGIFPQAATAVGENSSAGGGGGNGTSDSESSYQKDTSTHSHKTASPMFRTINLVMEDVKVRAMHPSVLENDHHLFQLRSTNLVLYCACQNSAECETWTQTIRVMSTDNERPRFDSSIDVWIYEAKSVKAKKRYFCKLYMDDILFGRTSCKRKTDTLFWGDWFRFNPVGNWKEIRIELYGDANRRRNHRGRELIGALRLCPEQLVSKKRFATGNSFQHPGGEYCDTEEWYPMETNQGSSDKTQQNPINIRVKTRYERLRILPIYFYDHLRLYTQHKYSFLINALESYITLKNKDDLASCLVNIAYYHGFWLSFLCDVIADEIANLKDNSLTFRGTSIATKSIEAFMRIVGLGYLKSILGYIIDMIMCPGLRDQHDNNNDDNDSSDLEVDPSRIQDTFTLKANRQRLIDVCDLIWKSLRNSYAVFPSKLKFLFAALRDRCKQHHGDNDELIDNLISSCFFLRFICPALLSPNLFGLTAEYPTEKNARKLTLIAKTLQTLANFSKFGNKEPFMKCMNTFVEREFDNMRCFIRLISCENDCDPNAASICEIHRTPPPPTCLSVLNKSNSKNGLITASSDKSMKNRWIDIGRQFSFLATLLSTIVYREDTLELELLDDLRNILDHINRFHVMEGLCKSQNGSVGGSNSSGQRCLCGLLNGECVVASAKTHECIKYNRQLRRGMSSQLELEAQANDDAAAAAKLINTKCRLRNPKHNNLNTLHQGDIVKKGKLGLLKSLRMKGVLKRKSSKAIEAAVASGQPPNNNSSISSNNNNTNDLQPHAMNLSIDVTRGAFTKCIIGKSTVRCPANFDMSAVIDQKARPKACSCTVSRQPPRALVNSSQCASTDFGSSSSAAAAAREQQLARQSACVKYQKSFDRRSSIQRLRPTISRFNSFSRDTYIDGGGGCGAFRTGNDDHYGRPNHKSVGCGTAAAATHIYDELNNRGQSEIRGTHLVRNCEEVRKQRCKICGEPLTAANTSSSSSSSSGPIYRFDRRRSSTREPRRGAYTVNYDSLDKSTQIGDSDLQPSLSRLNENGNCAAAKLIMTNEANEIRCHSALNGLCNHTKFSLDQNKAKGLLRAYNPLKAAKDNDHHYQHQTSDPSSSTKWCGRKLDYQHHHHHHHHHQQHYQ